MTREHTLTIVGNTDLSLLAWSDWLLGIRWHGATAASDSLVDDERLVTHIGEGEYCLLDRTGLFEGTEVVHYLFKLACCLS